jgi:hypothetical protein
MITKRLILMGVLISSLMLMVTGAAASTANLSYTVPYEQGAYYYWTVSGNSTLFANPINETNYIHIDDSQWHWNPMGAANGDPVAGFIYNGFACSIICIYAYISGRLRLRFNIVFVAIWGAIFWLVAGWLQISVMLISTAVAYSIIMYMRYAEEESLS